MHKIRLKFGAKTIDVIYNLERELKDADSRPVLFSSAWRIKCIFTNVRVLR
jgi:hypothetical protein